MAANSPTPTAHDARTFRFLPATEWFMRAVVTAALLPENAAQARQLGEALIAAADELNEDDGASK